MTEYFSGIQQVTHMINTDVWKAIAECLQDILVALEKNERIGVEDENVQIDREDRNGNNCDVD